MSLIKEMMVTTSMSLIGEWLCLVALSIMGKSSEKNLFLNVLALDSYTFVWRKKIEHMRTDAVVSETWRAAFGNHLHDLSTCTVQIQSDGLASVRMAVSCSVRYHILLLSENKKVIVERIDGGKKSS